MPEPAEPRVGVDAPAHEMLATDQASAWLGIELLRLGEGHATISMTLRREMLNGFEMAHGGMICAFADSAFALACNPVLPDGTLVDPASITVASGVDINYLRPAFAGQALTATANRRAGAGRSGIYDVQVTTADDGVAQVIAEFRGRSRTIPRPASHPQHPNSQGVTP